MEPTPSIYSTTLDNSAQDSTVSERLYSFLKAHTNWLWGSGVEIWDDKMGCLHPVHRNHKDILTRKFCLGHKFRPSVLTLKDVQQHLAGEQKSYLTGSMSAEYSLVYVDADCHEEWQDDPDDAVALLREFMEHLYVCESARGRNGYALLHRQQFISAQSINRSLDVLQMALRKMFLFMGIKTIIEIKGHVQHVTSNSYYCGTLAKLPNYGGMTHEQFEALTSTSRLSIRSIREFATETNKITGISDEVVRAYYKQVKNDKSRQPDLQILLTETHANNTAVSGLTVSPCSTQHVAQDSVTNKPATKTTSRGCTGGDSFSRGFEVCLKLARSLRRVPSVEEVLDYLRENRLYTGSWEENERKRWGRIAYNLAYISKTFDLKKIGGKPVSLDLAEHRRWVGERYPGGIGSTTPDEVNVFMAITKFCVRVDPNDDGTLPYQRFRKLWESLYRQKLVVRQFRWNRFAEIRDQLIRDKVVVVSGEIARNRALMWKTGPAFPGCGEGESVQRGSQPGVSQCQHGERKEEKKEERNLTLCLQPLKEEGSVEQASATNSAQKRRKEEEEEERNLTLCLLKRKALFRQMEADAIEIVRKASWGQWEQY